MTVRVVGRTKPAVVVGRRDDDDDDDANACDDDDGTKANAFAVTEEVAKMLIAAVAALENLIIANTMYSGERMKQGLNQNNETLCWLDREIEGL